MATPRRFRPTRQLIDQALPGGGAHGAFSWGEWDSLLEDHSLVISGCEAAERMLHVHGNDLGRLSSSDLGRGRLK
jgi:hypothetical protein